MAHTSLHHQTNYDSLNVTKDSWRRQHEAKKRLNLFAAFCMYNNWSFLHETLEMHTPFLFYFFVKLSLVMAWSYALFFIWVIWHHEKFEKYYVISYRYLLISQDLTCFWKILCQIVCNCKVLGNVWWSGSFMASVFDWLSICTWASEYSSGIFLYCLYEKLLH